MATVKVSSQIEQRTWEGLRALAKSIDANRKLRELLAK